MQGQRGALVILQIVMKMQSAKWKPQTNSQKVQVLVRIGRNEEPAIALKRRKCVKVQSAAGHKGANKSDG